MVRLHSLMSSPLFVNWPTERFNHGWVRVCVWLHLGHAQALILGKGPLNLNSKLDMVCGRLFFPSCSCRPRTTAAIQNALQSVSSPRGAACPLKLDQTCSQVFHDKRKWTWVYTRDTELQFLFFIVSRPWVWRRDGIRFLYATTCADCSPLDHHCIAPLHVQVPCSEGEKAFRLPTVS